MENNRHKCNHCANIRWKANAFGKLCECKVTGITVTAQGTKYPRVCYDYIPDEKKIERLNRDQKCRFCGRRICEDDDCCDACWRKLSIIRQIQDMVRRAVKGGTK